jgi:L-lactate permease
VVEQGYGIAPKRKRVLRFFIQWAVFSVIGVLLWLASLRLDSHFHPPLAVVVVWMPAYFLLGMVFRDLGPSTAARVLDAAAFTWDVMYYGIVLLVAWWVSISVLRRTTARSGSK